MNRRIVFAAQIPLSGDFLQSQKDTLLALGQLAQDLMTGPNASAMIVGLTCMPTNPASMSVSLGPGSVYQPGPLDGTAFGSLPADSTPAFQQGFTTATQTIGGFVAPTGAGQSINYLLQVQFQQVDARPLVLPYYNSANPQVPLVGPGGAGTSQNTDRNGTLAVQVISGAAATTGSQVTPPVTTGWLAAYVVTVATGQTAIASANIARHPLAPFLASITSRHHLGLPGTAPKIDLATEVSGSLPGGVGLTFGQGITTAPDGTVIPDYSGTGAAAHPARSDHTHSNDTTGGLTGAPFAKLGSASGATSANSTVVHANSADSATTATSATSAGHASSADSATNATHASTADSATNASYATTAGSTSWADSAGSANSAGSATSASSASLADALSNQMDGQGGVGLTETKFKASGYYYSNLNFVSVNVPSGRNYVGAIAYLGGYDGDPGDSGHRPGLSFGGTKITTDEYNNYDGRVMYFWAEA